MVDLGNSLPSSEGVRVSFMLEDLLDKWGWESLSEMVAGDFAVLIPFQFSNKGGEVGDVFI